MRDLNQRTYVRSLSISFKLSISSRHVKHEKDLSLTPSTREKKISRHPHPKLTPTPPQVLWTLKEEHLLEDLEELIPDDLFELVCDWVARLPDTSLLKKSLDALVCSMCYIRPELFRALLRKMDVPLDDDDER